MSGSTLSDGSGNYAISSLTPGGSYTVTPTKSALALGSTGINTIDVIATQRHFLNIGTPLSGCRLTAADVNGDTSINTIDVIAIQRFFLGLPTGIANTGKYQFSPASRTYPAVGSDQTAQNYDTLVFGDVASPFADRPDGL
jgi:Dockerin type I domain